MKAFALILGAGLLGAASALPAKLTKREICNLACTSRSLEGV